MKTLKILFFQLPWVPSPRFVGEGKEGGNVDSKMRGFTLLELLTVLGIIALLSIVGFSGIIFFSQKSESDVAESNLINAIQLTRAEAIARHEKVILCGSPDQVECSPDWDKGYLIKTASRILYHFPAHTDNQRLQWRSFPTHKPQLEFLPDGLSYFQNGTFRFYQKEATAPDWAVVLNKAGRVRVMTHPETRF
ncbi:MAG TPA: GspH/FimT family pseudopilin [Gammaproteobacteria bacterium]|nr:GspH/FimT family pseudopilin [Gammaproteobacteria bacterium]